MGSSENVPIPFTEFHTSSCYCEAKVGIRYEIEFGIGDAQDLSFFPKNRAISGSFIVLEEDDRKCEGLTLLAPGSMRTY